MKESGYSGNYYRDDRGYSRGYRMDDDQSFARRRDSMGRYSHGGFMDKLMDLKAAAPDDKHRAAIDRMMSELEH